MAACCSDREPIPRKHALWGSFRRSLLGRRSPSRSLPMSFASNSQNSFTTSMGPERGHHLCGVLDGMYEK